MNIVSSERFMKGLETGEVKGSGSGDDYMVPECVTFLKGVSYGNVNGRELLLDAFCREERPTEPRPAIIFIHGGGFSKGSPTSFYPQAAYFALKYDIFAVSVGYRLMNEALFPAAIQDCKCAVRWLRSAAGLYNIDTERIAAAGASTGGNLAAMLAVTKGIEEFEGNGGHHEFSSHVNLAVAYNGLFNYYKESKNFTDPERVQGFRRRAYLASSDDEIIENYRKASPNCHLNKDMPPMLFLHGSNDNAVSFRQSIEMFAGFWNAGVPAEIEIYAGVGHGWFNTAPHILPVLNRVETFVEKHFRLI